jgi:hypothetical protein
MSRPAKIDSRCGVCRGLIRKGDQQEWFGASGDLPAVAMHPGCVDAYERRVAAEQAPARPPVPVWTAPGHPISEPAADSLPCADCGRPSGAERLVELTDKAPAWLRAAYKRYRPQCPECALSAAFGARAATTIGQDGDEQRAPAGTAGRERSSDAGRMRKPDPRAALGGEAAGPAGEIEERGGAPGERTGGDGEERHDR